MSPPASLRFAGGDTRATEFTDAAQNSTIYGYDTENNMVGITDAANHQTAFAYDALGRVTQVTFPSTHTEGYTYDAVNNLLSKTDRKGHTISYGYDALYRLTSKTYPDSTAVNYTYDPLSRLTQVTDPSGTYSFTYDNLGRLLGTGTQYSFLSGTLTHSYAYDAASNRTSFTSSESGTTNYAYDSLNRLTSFTDSNSGQFGFGYDVLGRRTSLTRPNGVGTSYSYDTLSRLLSVLHNGGALPGSTSYTYDAAGNRTSKTAVQEGSPNPVSVTSQYSYDNIYELTQAVVGGTLAESYSYDAVGNRLSSAGPVTYNYNASNELTSSSTAAYTYDNNGNTASKTTSAGTTSYAWDFENRLTSVTLPGAGATVYLRYDPFGRRIYKSTSASTNIYVYDGDNVVQELNAAGSVVAQYTQGEGIDELLAMSGGASTDYFHADGLGAITSLTDSVGGVASSFVYDSFGNLTASSGTLANPFQYIAREFDSETGLYYFRARYYDPATGRFVSEDPTEFADGLNLYRYVRDNPILYSDPTGLTTYRGFTAADQAQLEAAVQKVKDKLNSCSSASPSCAGAEKGKLLNALENATFVFNQKLKGIDCGRVYPLDYIKHRAQIGPDAFGPGCCYQGPSSNALPSTVLHEAYHLVHKIPHEPTAYGLEKECFGCQRPPR